MLVWVFLTDFLSATQCKMESTINQGSRTSLSRTSLGFKASFEVALKFKTPSELLNCFLK